MEVRRYVYCAIVRKSPDGGGQSVGLDAKDLTKIRLIDRRVAVVAVCGSTHRVGIVHIHIVPQRGAYTPSPPA